MSRDREAGHTRVQRIQSDGARQRRYRGLVPPFGPGLRLCVSTLRACDGFPGSIKFLLHSLDTDSFGPIQRHSNYLFHYARFIFYHKSMRKPCFRNLLHIIINRSLKNIEREFHLLSPRQGVCTLEATKIWRNLKPIVRLESVFKGYSD